MLLYLRERRMILDRWHLATEQIRYDNEGVGDISQEVCHCQQFKEDSSSSLLLCVVVVDQDRVCYA